MQWNLSSLSSWQYIPKVLSNKNESWILKGGWECRLQSTCLNWIFTLQDFLCVKIELFKHFDLYKIPFFNLFLELSRIMKTGVSFSLLLDWYEWVTLVMRVGGNIDITMQHQKVQIHLNTYMRMRDMLLLFISSFEEHEYSDFSALWQICRVKNINYN